MDMNISEVRMKKFIKKNIGKAVFVKAIKEDPFTDFHGIIVGVKESFKDTFFVQVESGTDEEEVWDVEPSQLEFNPFS